MKKKPWKSGPSAFEKRRDRGQTIDDLNALVAEGKTFAGMLIDPAWEFKVYSGTGSAERHYDTMALGQMKKLPVAQLAAPDCALFLWCVWTHLPDALALLDAWDFGYKTVGFVWLKTTKNATSIAFDGTGIAFVGDGQHTGLGHWTRANTEFCLLAVKGAPKRMDKDVDLGEHSQKPDCVHAKIEALVLRPIP
jgi:N6-adenosine-specific RNA methylase IME4